MQLQRFFVRVRGHQPVIGPAAQYFGDHRVHLREHLVAGGRQDQRVVLDVQLQEVLQIAGPAHRAHLCGDGHELCGHLLRGVLCCEFGGSGFDGGAQLRERAQLDALTVGGQPPADDRRVELVPPFGRQHADSDPLDRLHQAQRLQYAHGLAHHRARDPELGLEVLGEHDVAGGELAGLTIRVSEALDGSVVEAGRHSRKHNAVGLVRADRRGGRR